ncbi:MAG: NAD(P)/FAD-dependent oxidoreductase, partial [Candidatus Eisenbacteria bacterium]
MPHKYCIIGGGLAAASAIEGIRQHDKTGSILMLTRENHPPYQRPPLTKDLWYGTVELARLPVHPEDFYIKNGVELFLRHDIEEIDVEAKLLWDGRGDSYGYEELLLATGCRPRRLHAQGADLPCVRYFRDLEDYLDLESRMDRFQHVTIVGGGFTGVEMAAALRSRDKEVTLIFPEEYPLHRFLPRSIGVGLVEFLREQGIETVSGDTLVHLEEHGGYVHARSHNGNELTTQIVLVDNGGEALSDLADAAGLDTDDGIVVDEYGHSSKPHVWAAGDVAEFPYMVLGQLRRVEGSDHAEHHGRLVGGNMAGAGLVYSHM